MSTTTKILYMKSFSRSGETVLLRHLNAHPEMQAGYDLTDSAAEQKLKRAFFKGNLSELSAAQAKELAVKKRVVVAKAVWRTGDLPGFALSRHPLAVVGSVIWNFLKAVEAGANDERINQMVEKINRIVGYVDVRIGAVFQGSMRLDDVAVKLAVAWSQQMADAYRSGCPVIRYEDFVAGPEGELRNLCFGLGLTFDSAMLTAEQAYVEGDVGHGGCSLSKPIRSTGIYDKSMHLTARQREIVNMICAETMDMFGYDADPIPE